MDLVFRKLASNEMERPPTQRDQFNNDDVDLVDALVREAIQNSLDAKNGESKVKVVFKIRQINAESIDQAYIFLNIGVLGEHMKCSGLGTDFLSQGSIKYLTVEDFGTTGLTGATSTLDKGPFCDFWRRMGVSNKSGKSLGRWGLGKLVFSSASSARLFLGYTSRFDDPGSAYLMGQAVLTTHTDQNGVRYDSHGFYSVVHADGFQAPYTDSKELDVFRKLFQTQRKLEPGLTVVVPFVNDQFCDDAIIRGVIRNYFFPILTGQLVVEVGEKKLNADSFSEYAKKCGDHRFADGELASFISEVQAAGNSDSPAIELPKAWAKQNADVFLKKELDLINARMSLGQIIHIKAPIVLKRKSGDELETKIELFIKKAKNRAAESLFVRDTIVLPAEAKYFRGKDVHVALVAKEKSICEFLGDAENPAHTSWSASAEKLTIAWRSPAERLREVRGLAQKVYNALSTSIESLDENLLVDIFGIPSPSGSAGPGARGRNESKPPLDIPNPQKRKYRVGRLVGGFEIRPSLGLEVGDLPMTIKVRAAYDVLRGNPFTKYDELDFNFNSNSIVFSADGATHTIESPNSFLVEITKPDFVVSVSGFDLNRDLIVDPVRKS